MFVFPKDHCGVVNEGPGWSGVSLKNLPEGSILAI